MNKQHLDTQKLRDIADRLTSERATPCLVVSGGRARSQYELFRELFPRVETVYYAVKSNPDVGLLRSLADAGASFDAASSGEIRLVLDICNDPSRIIFANPVKKPSDIEFARDVGVHLSTFDNETELLKIQRAYANFPVKPRVLLRLWVPNHGSVVNLSGKFGAQPEDAPGLLQKAVEMGIEAEGVAFHVGSQCLNPGNYRKSFQLACEVIGECRSRGLELGTLDIGGGFPIDYDMKVSYLDEIVRAVGESVAELVPEGVKIVAEPGRFLSGPAAVLFASVISMSERDDRRWYYLDDSIYGTYSGRIFDHCEYQFKSFREGEETECVVAGCSCDGLDILSPSARLPELSLGEVLYSPDMGAYTLASASSFNGFPPAPVVNEDF